MSDSTISTSNADALAERLASQRARQQARTTSATAAPDRDRQRRTSRWQRWMRWLHVYASMIAFLVILFFGVTGLLLNHPSWLGGDELVTTTVEGTLPETVRTDSGGVEFLAVSEYLRSEHDVGGTVTNFDQLGDEGSINYTGPGYGASARFDVTSLTYSVTIAEEGFVNAMRDLHTGSDTNAAWGWIIDLSAVFLIFVAVTGLAIQLLMRKRRSSAMGWMAAGSVAALAIGWFTLA